METIENNLGFEAVFNYSTLGIVVVDPQGIIEPSSSAKAPDNTVSKSAKSTHQHINTSAHQPQTINPLPDQYHIFRGKVQVPLLANEASNLSRRR